MLWVALIVMGAMGAVGFLDDFIKLKRKHNMGLSARAKFTRTDSDGVGVGHLPG